MSFDSQISNFYEKLMIDEINRRPELESFDDDIMIDIACVAMNQLPSRYYRYSVDMAFYLSASEFIAMEKEVKAAVDHAVVFVNEHKSRN